MEKFLSVENEVLVTVIQQLIDTARQHPGRYISPALLRKILRGYRQWRLGRKTNLPLALESSIIGVERSLVHYLIERCYWIRYGDCESVSYLLNELYSLDGHLGKILDFQQLSLTPRDRKSELGKTLKTTWKDQTLLTEEMQPIHYFMEHAYKMKVLFNGKRLAEHYFVQSTNRYRELNDLLLLPPCARTFAFPQVLANLLQYGLFADSTTPDTEEIGKLLTGIIGVILNSYGKEFLPEYANREVPEYANHEVPEYAARIVEVGNVLLRAVPSVRMSTLLREQRLKNKERFLTSLVERLSCPSLLPLLQRRCSGSPELQHMCRRSIRRTLYINWKLPHGITFLPLPSSVKKYINLERD